MKANGVLVILGTLLCCTTTCYYFYIPDHIGGSTSQQSQSGFAGIKNLKGPLDADGYWGHIDAEFNWCEYNYHHSYYIAEPYNVFTSFIFVIVAAIGAYLYGHLGSIVYDFMYLDFMFCLIGIGSMLYHATLKYSMQLLDEIPMFYLASYACVILYFRNIDNITGQDDSHIIENKIHKNKYRTTTDLYKNKDKLKENPIAESKSQLFTIAKCITIFGDVLLTVVLFATDRVDDNNGKLNLIHNIARGIMTVTFSCCFLYIFIAGANAAQEADSELPNKNKTVVNDVFDKSFFWFIFGIVSWLLDNFCCDTLQNLPFGIPYLQWHAFGWHMGCVFGVYYFFQLLILHRFIVNLKYDFEPTNLKIKSFYGLITYVDIKYPKNE